MTERERLTTERAKIFARESITLNSMNKDELRRHYNEIFDRLQEYEVKEENGLLLRLPCKVGDKVYRLSTKATTKKRYIQETLVSRIAIDGEGIWLFCTCNPIAKCIFGKTVFLTREEAEAALKGGAE